MGIHSFINGTLRLVLRMDFLLARQVGAIGQLGAACEAGANRKRSMGGLLTQ
jgi:hypothetical protein